MAKTPAGDRDPGDHDGLGALPTGLGRTLSTVGMTARLGLRMARRVYLGKARPREIDEAVARAERLVERLGGLKGLVMKAGQIASYMPGAMPPEAQAVLARLQSKSTAMAFEPIAGVIREELGQPAGELFDEIERQPFAAASIGQVHRARVGERAVAVKVQYPGVEDVIRGDLRTIKTLARMSLALSDIDGGAVTDELRTRLLEECDYLREADNQRMFAGLLGGLPDCRVPAVVGERSARRVLTTELVDGAGFLDFCARADQAARDRAGQAIFRACFETLFGRCTYNCDPHPGNYLLEPDGVVWFLDFGCVRRFDPAMIAVWKQTARAVLAGDRRGMRDGFVALGFVRNPRRFDWDHQWLIMQHIYQPYLEPGFRYSHEYVRSGIGPMMFDNPNRNRTALPPAWLFLNRIQWGLNSVLAHLGASGRWGEWFRAAVEQPEDPA